MFSCRRIRSRFETTSGLILQGKDLMKITENLHAFVWESMTTNNCNSYLIDGPTRVLIDPGHSRLFDHVELGLKQLGLTISDIGVII